MSGCGPKHSSFRRKCILWPTSSVRLGLQQRVGDCVSKLDVGLGRLKAETCENHEQRPSEAHTERSGILIPFMRDEETRQRVEVQGKLFGQRTAGRRTQCERRACCIRELVEDYQRSETLALVQETDAPVEKRLTYPDALFLPQSAERTHVVATTVWNALVWQALNGQRM